MVVDTTMPAKPNHKRTETILVPVLLLFLLWLSGGNPWFSLGVSGTGMQKVAVG